MLPILPPARDARVWARLVRVMFYTPGFLALLLLKVGEPTGFGVSVELFMLASATAIVGGLFIGSQSDVAGADHASRIGTWSGALVLELLAVVPLLCAVPTLFHELAFSRLLHDAAPGAAPLALGVSQFIPAAAILPFMLYQLAGFGTLHFVVSNTMNWVINLCILALIVGANVANRQADFGVEKACVVLLVSAMVITVFYGVLKLKKLQTLYDTHLPSKPPK
ncbi:MAG: hypothetical protein ABI633_04915 [Burkholderiales bacterium]